MGRKKREAARLRAMGPPNAPDMPASQTGVPSTEPRGSVPLVIRGDARVLGGLSSEELRRRASGGAVRVLTEAEVNDRVVNEPGFSAPAPREVSIGGHDLNPDPWGVQAAALLGPLPENQAVRGLSPDEPTVTNDQGGSQSHLPYRLDLIDARAMFKMAEVLHAGAEKYGEDNWRLIPTEDHLNHLLAHVFAFLMGDRQDDHLSHALCRATFALGVELQPQEGGLPTSKAGTGHYAEDDAHDAVKAMLARMSGDSVGMMAQELRGDPVIGPLAAAESALRNEDDGIMAEAGQLDLTALSDDELDAAHRKATDAWGRVGNEADRLTMNRLFDESRRRMDVSHG